MIFNENEIIRYANWFVSRCNNLPRNEIEDMRQECVLNIWKNKDKFDPDRGKFSTFAFWICKSTITREMNKFIRRNKFSFLSDNVEIEVQDDINVIDRKIDCEITGDTTYLIDRKLDI